MEAQFNSLTWEAAALRNPSDPMALGSILNTPDFLTLTFEYRRVASTLNKALEYKKRRGVFINSHSSHLHQVSPIGWRG